MRRSLIMTVAATTTIVLIALLVPMAVLVGQFAFEDRLARAALEVQATETVVSGQDKGSVSVHLADVNSRDVGIRTTVLYPDGSHVGPDPGEDTLVRDARSSGQARVDDIPGGAQILVPVSLGGSSALPANTPVVRVQVLKQGFVADVRRSWLMLAVLGLALLAGSLVVADRLGRSFVDPMRSLAGSARQLSSGVRVPIETGQGPSEVRDVATALDLLVVRLDALLMRERVAVADLSHRLRTPMTRLRLAVDGLGAQDRDRVAGDVDALGWMIDEVVREARRTEREGIAPQADLAEVVQRRTEFWRPLAEDQGRALAVHVDRSPILVRASEPDVVALVDALIDNVFSHTPEGASLSVEAELLDDRASLTVEDAGPGFPPGFDPMGRGASVGGSTGLGLDIVERTARATGGAVIIGRTPRGGARVRVTLGAPGGEER